MNTVIDTIYTLFERDAVLTFLTQFERNIFNSGIDVKSYISQIFPKTGQALIVYFGDDLEKGNREELFHKSSELRKTIEAIKVIKISVSKTLDEQSVAQISIKLRELTGISVFMELLINNDLIGGAIVESNGFLTEYSFRKYFEDQQMNRRQHGL